MEPQVFVVIVHWHRPLETIACIHSLQDMEYSNFRVVIMDNASRDGSVALIQERFPNIAVLENAENLGYAGGNNAGIRHALAQGAEYILLLNNDTVVDKGMLRALIRAAQSDPAIGIVGPKIYRHSQPGRLWFAGARIEWATGDSPHIGLGEEDCGQYEGVVETDRLTGCAMLVKRQVFETIGLLDPDYFLYYEDVDFCVRAKRAGFKNLCARHAKVWHKESSSTGANEGSLLHAYYHERNRLLFLKKHGGPSGKAAWGPREFCKAWIRHALRYCLNRSYRRADARRFWARLAAMRDFSQERFGIKAKYHAHTMS